MTPTITLTDLAKQKLDEYLAEEPSDTVVRLLVEDDGKYGLSLDQRGDGDTPVEGSRGITVVVESAFAAVVDGLKVDYLDQGASSGFSLTGGKPHRAGKPVVLGSQPTPNPDALKFRLAIPVGATSRSFTSADAAGCPKAVQEALGVDGVVEVFLKDRFATVVRASGGPDWSELEPKLTEALAGLDEVTEEASEASGDALEARLARFIASDVAPFLQRDGGDIELVGVEEGVVRVRLQGACGTCPSATATLHAGVERRLKAEFEQVTALERV